MFRIARILGFDVKIHWTWLVIFAALTYTYAYGTVGDSFPEWTESRRIVVGGGVAVIFFLSILLHEMSHSLVARRYGIPVDGITLFLFGGVSNLGREPESAREEFWIAVVGPATSLLLAGAFAVGYIALDPIESRGADLLLHLALLNLVLAAFNLIPGFPLDGGRVLRSFFWSRRRDQLDATRLTSKIAVFVAYCLMGSGVIAAVLVGDLFLGFWMLFIGNMLRNSAAASYDQLFLDKVLTGIPATSVATREYTAVSPEVTLSDLVENHVLKGPGRAFPVMAGEELLGLVTLSDVQGIPQNEWPTTTVYRAMTPVSKLRSVSPKDDLPRVLEELAAGDVNQIPMLDGRLLEGMIYRGDVLRYIQVRQALSRNPPAIHRRPPSA